MLTIHYGPRLDFWTEEQPKYGGNPVPSESLYANAEESFGQDVRVYANTLPRDLTGKHHQKFNHNIYIKYYKHTYYFSVPKTKLPSPERRGREDICKHTAKVFKETQVAQRC